MMLQTLMKDYLKEREKSSSTPHSEEFGLVVEVTDAEVPLEPERSEWIIHEGPERLVRQYQFDDIKIRNWFVSQRINFLSRTQ